MSVTPEQIQAGQAVYTRRNLRLYDFLVLGISNRLIWKCPTPVQLEHYNQHASDNHLDVGVGSGFYPSHCTFSKESPRIALMDLNPDALKHAADRIACYAPETYQRDVLKPIPFDGDRFDSVAINYLIHCLPGTLKTKAVLLDHVSELMNPDAVLFGSTLLHHGVKRSWAAKRLMNFYNSKGIFTNNDDSLSELRHALEHRFVDVQIKSIGCAALFSARKGPAVSKPADC